MQRIEIPPLWKHYRIFDTHAHIGDCYDLSVFHTVEKLIEKMDKYNISYTLVSSIARDMKAGNDYVIESLKKYPDKIIGSMHINPWEKGYLDEIKRCVDHGFKAIKLHPHYDCWNVYEPELICPILESAAEFSLAVEIHTGTPPMSLPLGAAMRAKDFQTVPLVLVHSGMTDSIGEAVIAAKMNDNVYLNLSSTSIAAGLFENFLGETDGERILFATDSPYLYFMVNFFKIMALRIPEKYREKIFFDNAEKLFGPGK